MSRIAAHLCGEVDPADPYYPAWFGPHSRVETSGSGLLGIWNSTWQDARDFYCRYALLDFSWSFSSVSPTDSGSGSGQAGLGGDVTGNGYITEERGLVTLLNTAINLVDPGTGEHYFHIYYQLGEILSITLCDYDNSAKTFNFVPVISWSPSVTLRNQTVGMIIPTLAGTATIFGNSVPMYFDAAGGSTCTASLSVSVNSYWPYDNGLTALPTDGPIYDASTGAQLITPTPLGL